LIINILHLIDKIPAAGFPEVRDFSEFAA